VGNPTVAASLIAALGAVAVALIGAGAGLQGRSRSVATSVAVSDLRGEVRYLRREIDKARAEAAAAHAGERECHRRLAALEARRNP
jgi:hypothetical protein